LARFAVKLQDTLLYVFALTDYLTLQLAALSIEMVFIFGMRGTSP
jgi:hypothetical protein